MALGLGLSLPTGQALAQSQIPPPASFNPVDANGVNLQTGGLEASTPTISIGPKDGGLSYSRSYDSSTGDVNFPWRDSTAGGLAKWPVIGEDADHPWYTATVMGSSVNFTESGGVYTPAEGDNATLVLGTSGYTFTAADGTVAVFGGAWVLSPFIANRGLISSITKPSGEVITFTYTTTTYNNGSGMVTASRLQSVTNNFGYQLQFQYVDDTAPGSTDWNTPLKVTALNNAYDACAPTAYSCSYSRIWPSLTFGGSYADRTVTDTLSRTTHFLGGFPLTGVRYPSRTSGQNITAAWTGFETAKVHTLTTDAGTWTYDIPDPPVSDLPQTEYTTTSTVTEPQVNYPTPRVRSITIRSKLYSPLYARRVDRIVSSTNADGKTTTYGYTTKYKPYMVTQPEGDKVIYGYDSRGNINSLTRYSKDGASTLAMSAAFPSSCTAVGVSIKTCNKPTSATDFRGNTTTFTYDTAHGGVLTATSPAPTSGAPQPQVRTSYAAFQARYKDSAGALVSGSAIYLPTATSQCVTTASCSGTADEVKTTTSYQAGSPSLASNLLPLTTTSLAGDGSLSAVTTVDYNYLGDVRIVDGPLPGNQDATRTYYDVGRQVIGVIGPDPDGTGPLLYRASRTTYNPDGQVTLVETGTAESQSDAAMGSFAPLAFTRSTYGSTGKLIKVEAGQP